MVNYIRQQAPFLDVHKQFMFFANSKTGIGSITRGPLNNRCLQPIATLKKLKKRKNYKVFFDSWTDKEIENAFKFTVIRNPWSRAVSAFFFLRDMEKKRIKIDSDETFQNFVKTRLVKAKNPADIDWHFHWQFPNVFFGNTVFVNCPIRFEHLEDAWLRLSPMIGCSPGLPHYNKVEHEHYTKYYDEETRSIIGKIYEKDIKCLRYNFYD